MEDRDSFAEKYNHCIDTEENSCSAVNVDYILMYTEGNSNMLFSNLCDEPLQNLQQPWFIIREIELLDGLRWSPFLWSCVPKEVWASFSTNLRAARRKEWRLLGRWRVCILLVKASHKASADWDGRVHLLMGESHLAEEPRIGENCGGLLANDLSYFV